MREKVIVFGRGTYYRFKKEDLESKYQIVAFIDNAVGKDSPQVEEKIPVYHPNEIINLPSDIKICIMALKWFPMYRQLAELGVEDKRILFGIQREPFFDKFESFLKKRGISVKGKNGSLIVYDQGISYLIEDEEDYHRYVRKLYSECDNCISSISSMELTPSSVRHGLERGKIIDRVYIERFISEQKQHITGIVMEMGENLYTERYGHDIEQSLIFHVQGWGKNAIKGNFETGEGMKKDAVDCLICTQTFTEIYDIHSSVKNIYNMLKPGGTFLMTCGGSGGGPISLTDYHNWGSYWKFTDKSLRRLLEEVFEKEKIEVFSYGNVKTLIAFLYGMCAEELQEKDFDYYDERYPMIVAAVARK